MTYSKRCKVCGEIMYFDEQPEDGIQVVCSPCIASIQHRNALRKKVHKKWMST
jgi:formylmethanofuran dehydrogenase subunit E